MKGTFVVLLMTAIAALLVIPAAAKDEVRSSDLAGIQKRLEALEKLDLDSAGKGDEHAGVEGKEEHERPFPFKVSGEMRVREDDPAKPALRRERQRLGQRARVQRRLAVDDEGRHPIAGRGPAVGSEHPDRESFSGRHAARIVREKNQTADGRWQTAEGRFDGLVSAVCLLPTAF